MIDRAHFWFVARQSFGAFSQTQVDAVEFLLHCLETDDTMTDRRWQSYAMATVKHETADTYRPIVEHGGADYFDKYEPGTRLGVALGNTEKGDCAWFKGRGFVQLTGRENYRKFGEILGVDLLTAPSRACEPGIAYSILSIGMVRGLFTGRKLSDYLNSDADDYRNARRIINGLDRADLIAGYAVTFEKALSG